MEYGILISGMHYFLIVDYHLAAVSRRFETICATFTALLTRTESRRGKDGKGSAKNVEGKAPNEPARDVSILCEVVVTRPFQLSSRIRSKSISQFLRTDWHPFLSLGHTEDALSLGQERQR